eukprot:g2040.t1
MEPLSHERSENIALTFTQNPMGSQRLHDNSSKMPPIFGAESMREARLEPSVLGSIIPLLDPDTPDPSLNSSGTFVVGSTPSPAGAGTKRPRSPIDPAVAGRPSAPVSGEEGPREWAEGTAEVAAGEATGGAGTRMAGGVVPPQQEAEVARRRKSRVRHGLRVLLRGTSRCGKSTILWDYCHRAAMAGYRVVLVCLNKYDGEELANLPRSMRAGRVPGGGDELQGWEAPALGRIGIKYVRSRDDLAWYLASLHTLKRAQWPTIIETSAGGGGGGIGAAALRILALLQDTAEFFDKSRAGALSAAAADGGAAAAASDSNVVGAGGGGVRGIAACPPLPSGNLDLGSEGFAGTPEEAGRTARDRLVGGEQEEEAVRVVGTCSMSDRGMLSLYGRFVHAVAKL